MVDTSAGVWSDAEYGGMNGWVYAARTTRNLALWGVIGNSRATFWYALNNSANEINADVGISMPLASVEMTSGLLSDSVLSHIESCL